MVVNFHVAFFVAGNILDAFLVQGNKGVACVQGGE
jgi:hypothetical protein